MSWEPKSDGIIFRHVRIQDSDRRGFQTIRLCWRCQDWKPNSTVLHKTVAATEKNSQEKSFLPVRNHGISKNSHPCKIVCCRKGRLIPEMIWFRTVQIPKEGCFILAFVQISRYISKYSCFVCPKECSKIWGPDQTLFWRSSSSCCWS